MKKSTVALAVLLVAALIVCIVFGAKWSGAGKDRDAKAKELSDALGKIETLEKDVEGLTKDAADKQGKIDDMTAQAEQLTADVEEKAQQIAKLTGEAEEKAAQITELTDKLAAAEGEREDLSGQIDTLKARLGDVEKLSEEYSARIGELEGELAAVTAEKDALSDQLGAADTDKTAMSDRIAALTAEAEALEAQIGELTGKVSEGEEQSSGLKAQIEELEGKVLGITAERDELSQKLGAADSEKAGLSEEIAALTAEAEELKGRVGELTREYEGERGIVILNTSDVHCGVDQGFSFVGLAAIRDELAVANDVILADVGDAVQGEALGTMTRGAAIVELMNAVGYDVATLGNHEFDYGVERVFELIEMADFPYVSCNFNKEGELLLPPYVIIEKGGVKIAFVGISTPETLTSSTPTYFQDAEGNYIYGFCEDQSGEKLIESVQKAVDAARAEGADYVIALAHLGNEASVGNYCSNGVIAGTTGIDVVLDGHEHAVGLTKVANKDGAEVQMVSCGTKMQGIGCVRIDKEGGITTDLYLWDSDSTGTYADLVGADNKVFAALKAATEELNKELATVIARSDFDLCIKDPATDQRIVRNRETNLGDLCADAYRAVSGADIALLNGGGVRTNIAAGDITKDQVFKVHPFGNKLCVVEATGQQILDCLEWTSRSTPEEFGGFLQASGLSYEIHTYIPSSATQDDHGMCTGFTGERRVQNVKVAGEPIDPEKTYTVASVGYILKDFGDGNNLFKDAKLLLDDIMLDNQVLITYVSENLGGVIPQDYADPYGQGRITIVETAPATVETAPAAESAEQ